MKNPTSAATPTDQTAAVSPEVEADEKQLAYFSPEPMRIPLRHRISFRMTRLCVAAAVGIGILISIGQILIDSRSESARMDAEINSLIDIVTNPATEAAYNIDTALAQTVVLGLTGNTGVYRTSIIIPPAEILGSTRREKQESPTRFLTNALFGEQRYYHRTLTQPDEPETVLGDLHVYVDTEPQGRAFLKRSALVILGGLVRAGILAAVLIIIFYTVLTRPLARFAKALTEIDPAEPARHKLPLSEFHADDELGYTVQTANHLLAAIEESSAHRQAAEDEASYLRQFDKLTDLPNRTLYYDRVSQSMRRARHEESRMCILHCDLTAFKTINDKYGYAVGDAVLRRFALRLRSAAPVFATVARVAGDQFGIMVESIEDPGQIADLAQSVLSAGEEPLNIEGHEIELNCCVGIAMYPDDATEIDELTQNAERALAMAKLRGHNHYQFYIAELDQAVRERQLLEDDLRDAIANDKLYMVYHPQFSAQTNELVGAEALVRWQDKQRGIVPPDVFVCLAEESDLILKLGEQVLNMVTSDLVSWRKAGLPRISVAVNVSAKQLKHGDLHEQVNNRLNSLELPPELLELEITETAIMEDIERARLILASMREDGVGLAMDDFGTGHSSLNYLRKLPFNKLKIDQSFVRDLRDTDNAMILNAIIKLGHSLHMTVVAEGIESPEQLNFLRDNDCDVVQGFHCSPPLAEADFRDLLRRQAHNHETAAVVSPSK